VPIISSLRPLSVTVVKGGKVSVVRRSFGRAGTWLTTMGEVPLRSAPGTKAPSFGVGDDVAVVIHDENGAAADAGLHQAVQNSVEGDDGRKHAAELIVHLQRHGHDECRLVFLAEARGSLRKTTDCGSGGKCALQGLADKGVLVGGKLPAPAPLPLLPTAVR
jgi:hypothetical protein